MSQQPSLVKGVRSKKVAAIAPVAPVEAPSVVSSPSSSTDAMHNVTVKLPVAVTDQLDELVFMMNKRARSEGRRKVAKRELVELAVKDLLEADVSMLARRLVR